MTKVLINETTLYSIGSAIRSKLGASKRYKPSEMPSAIMSISAGQDTDDANLTSGNQMLNGVTAYARGSKYYGAIQTYSGSVNGSSGTIPYYSGSYEIGPLTVTQSFPTAGMIMQSDLTVIGYSGSFSYYQGSYEATPSPTSQTFPTAGLIMQSDFTVLPNETSLVDISFSENGSYSAAGLGVDGFANVVVSVPQESKVLGFKYISSNGQYSALDFDFDGFSEVVVDVPSSYGVMVSLTASENGTYYPADYDADGFYEVTVIGAGGGGGGGIVPSGSISISENGTYDVTSFASAVVDVHPSLITSIPPEAYKNMSILKQAVFPDVATIGHDAFNGCSSLSSLYIPKCIDVGSSAFARCTSLMDVNFIDCQTIGESAFYNCVTLQNLSIQQCTTIGKNAFDFCEMLSTVVLPHAQELYPAFSGEYVTSIYLLDSAVCSIVSVDGIRLFTNTSEVPESTTIYVPSDVYSDYMSDSNWAAFSGIITSVYATLRSANITNKSQITEASYPYATRIGDSTFANASNLQSVWLENCEVIDEYAFGHCTALEYIYLPQCRSVDSYAFSQCENLTYISLPECQYIHAKAFYSCTWLMTVGLPKVLSIGSGMFSDFINLKSVDLRGCEAIGSYAFKNCVSLTTISLQNCKTIGSYAFTGCSALSVVRLPSAEVLKPAFTPAYMKNVYLPGSSVCNLSGSYNGRYLFYGYDAISDTRVYVPSSLYDAYLEKSEWQTLSSIMMSM